MLFLKEMALRKTILATGEIYHLLNHSVQSIPILEKKNDCKIFMEAMKYYLQPGPPTRFAKYRASRKKFPISLEKKLVTIVNFCLMPNHFHFTLRQEEGNGVRRFIQKLSNSFAHYYNIKYKNRGPVFEGNFKAVHIETDEQLLHLSRYIHLNPVTAYLVEDPDGYPYSSYRTYIGKEKSEIVDPSLVLDQVSQEAYQKFVLSRKDYQKELERIKHLILE